MKHLSLPFILVLLPFLFLTVAFGVQQNSGLFGSKTFLRNVALVATAPTYIETSPIPGPGTYHGTNPVNQPNPYSGDGGYGGTGGYSGSGSYNSPSGYRSAPTYLQQPSYSGGSITQPTGGGSITQPTGGGSITQPTGGSASQNSSGSFQNPLGSTTTLCQLFKNIFIVVFQLAVPVILFFIVLVGFKFVLARGNATELTKARNNLFFTIVGIGIFLGAWGLAMVVAGVINDINSRTGGSALITSC